jgi:hypothetical protein
MHVYVCSCKHVIYTPRKHVHSSVILFYVGHFLNYCILFVQNKGFHYDNSMDAYNVLWTYVALLCFKCEINRWVIWVEICNDVFRNNRTHGSR